MKVGDKIRTTNNIQGYIIYRNENLLWGFRNKIVVTEGNSLFIGGSTIELRDEDIEEVIDNNRDEDILMDNGWSIECESPLEIRHEDGSFATGQAAMIVKTYLKM